MSLHERTGARDLTYSRWHRPDSIGRYIDRRAASQLTMIDIDAVEVCAHCRRPIALIETKHSAAQVIAATFTVALAQMAGIRAYLVRYRTDDTDDIVGFRVQQLEPFCEDSVDWTPQQYADFLVRLRSERHHNCSAVN